MSIQTPCIARMVAQGIVTALVACIASGCDGASKFDGQSSAEPSAAFVDIEWKQLIPAEEMENYRLGVAFAMRKVDHNTDQRASQFGSFKTVASMDGTRIALAGYVVPLDTDDRGLMTSFFFVPTMGACIHVPPPPPDQMIFVSLSKPIAAPQLGEARQLKGTLHTDTHDLDLASAAYSMRDPQIELRTPHDPL